MILSKRFIRAHAGGTWSARGRLSVGRNHSVSSDLLVMLGVAEVTRVQVILGLESLCLILLVVLFIARVLGFLDVIGAVHLLLESLESSTLLVSESKDCEVVMGIVLLLKVLELLVIELFASWAINLV